MAVAHRCCQTLAQWQAAYRGRLHEIAEMKRKPKTGRGYAWLCESGLCHWAEPEKGMLMSQHKPSPEAKPARVRLVLEKDYRRMLK